MNAITIVHFITDLQMGGAERMLARLVTASDRHAFRHVVITLTPGGPFHDQIRAAGLEIHDLGMRRGRPSLSALWRAVQLLRRIKPHVVQTWLYHADALGSVAARLAGCPKVCWNLRCSDMDLSRYGRATRWVVQFLARISPSIDLILSNSQAGITAHQSLGYRGKRWMLIPNGVELGTYRPDPAARRQWRSQLGLAEDCVVFLMVARRDPMKDHPGFLSAARQVAANHANIAFIAAGRGVDQDADLRTMAAAIAAPVHLLGQTQPIESLMAAADVGVLASHFGEGFPNVLAESMACGLPCIATDVGDAAQVVGDTGQVLPPGDTKALAAAMARWEDPAMPLAAMGQAARQRVEQLYDITSIIRQYEDMWSDLVRLTGD